MSYKVFKTITRTAVSIKKLTNNAVVAETNLDLDQRQRDMDYNDAKRMHDMDREDDDNQFQQFMAMQNAEEQAKENQRKHEAEVEQNRLKTAEEMERLKWENAKELSDEKVWALKRWRCCRGLC